LAVLSAVLLVFGLSAVATAAPYGNGVYGECPYQTSCPVPETPQDPLPEPASEPDVSPDPNIVSADIDHDGNNETAVNTDGDLTNGFEEFKDPDGSSGVVAQVDGEHDGTKGYLVDTDGDGVPNVYWSPDDEYVSSIEVVTQGDETIWTFLNAKGELQYYRPSPKPKPQTPTTPPQSGDTTERRLTSGGFGGAPYEKLGLYIKRLPAPVAYSFPYVLLLLVVLLIVRLIWQTKRELARLKVALETIEREKGLVLEKQNFLMLASHYLRTPLTAIKANIELMQSLKQVPDATAAQLQAAANDMQAEANTLLTKLEENQGLGQIAVTHTTSEAWHKALLSPFVIGPFVFVFLLILFVNFIFADFRVTRPGGVDVFVQLALGGILAQWFLSTVRRRHLDRQNRLEQQRVVDAQRELDVARSNFITEASHGLSAKIEQFDQQLTIAANAGTDATRIRKALSQLSSIAEKFVFATQLQALAVQSSKRAFSSSDVVQSVVTTNQPKASAKNVLLQSQAQGGQINQNQELLATVLDSVVDNAIKYSSEQGSVQIDQTTRPGAVSFSVQDQGAGLSSEQLTTLFKPFSRAESVETFNTEGLGFSLYLDRLIMHYLGGDIAIQSEPGRGTKAELYVPTA